MRWSLLAVALFACSKGNIEESDTSVEGCAENQKITLYADADGDGRGDDATSLRACVAEVGYVAAPGDCDDNNPLIKPGAVEVCNTVDDDCDGDIDGDASDPNTYYADNDGDGYGDTAATHAACAPSTGFVALSGDCDDGERDIHPGVPEVCDGLDQDCDGEADDGLDVPWYADADRDGYGDPEVIEMACSKPKNFVATGDDCDDDDDAAHPGGSEVCDNADNDCDGTTDVDALDPETFYLDGDGDSYGDPGALGYACTLPDGYTTDSSDCDDLDSGVHPGATETCDGVDDDCDASVDEGVTTTFYADTDKDGYGTSKTTTSACSAPTGYVTNDDDCNDASASVSPAATETCDDEDDDCDGTIDNDVTEYVYYTDGDKDGYGDATKPVVDCSLPSGAATTDTDCDDTRAGVYPGATETCNSRDDDCDGSTDESGGTTWYDDDDGDGYGDAADSTVACSKPGGYVSNSTDCNDAEAKAYTGAAEKCDSVDNDCDGVTDPSTATDAKTWYADADGDTYGDTSSSSKACTQPSGYVSNKTDCDDTTIAARPGGTEICDSLDNDCDGESDWGLAVPDAYSEISDAIAAASSGQTICVAAGTYGAINLGGRSIEIEGAGSDVVTVDAGGSGSALTAYSGETATITGITFTGGAANYGAGMYTSGGALTLRDVVFDANNPEVSSSEYGGSLGGVMYLSGGTYHFTDVSITNTAVGGTLDGGTHDYFYVSLNGWAIYAGNVTMDWDGGVIADNALTTSVTSAGQYPYIYGYMVQTYSSTLNWSNLTFNDNTMNPTSTSTIDTSSSAQSAMFQLYYSAVDFDAVDVLDNRWGGTAKATYTGGSSTYPSVNASGLLQAYNYSGSGIAAAVNWKNSTISGNIAEGDSGYSVQAMLYGNLQSIDVTFDHVDFIGNGTGTLTATYPYCQGFYLYEANLTIKGSRFLGEDVDCTTGGASYGYYQGLIYAYAYSTPAAITITNSIFAGNTWNAGSGSVYGPFYLAQNYDFTMTNSVYSHNTLTANYVYGGLIFHQGGSSDDVVLKNSIFDNNATSGTYGTSGGMYYSTDTSTSSTAGTVSTKYNDFYANSATYALAWSDTSTNPTSADGNLAVDPAFTSLSGDPETWDLHLRATSTLRNAGDSSIYDVDGSRSDMGAYGGPGGE